MDLPSVSNAPRELPLGGVTYRARTLTLNQLGEVLAWLDDRLPAEGRGAGGLPLFSSEAVQLALATADGLAVVLHLSLASCHPTLTRDEARTLAGSLDDADVARLHAVAFRRRPNYAPPEPGRGKDLAEADWGILWEALSQHQAAAYAGAGELTLDQMDSYLARGEIEGPDGLTAAEVQAMWEAAPVPAVIGGTNGFVEGADAV
jgi:hypothetical protein